MLDEHKGQTLLSGRSSFVMHHLIAVSRSIITLVENIHFRFHLNTDKEIQTFK